MLKKLIENPNWTIFEKQEKFVLPFLEICQEERECEHFSMPISKEISSSRRNFSELRRFNEIWSTTFKDEAEQILTTKTDFDTAMVSLFDLFPNTKS